MSAERSITSVLPLKGLWRAGLLDTQLVRDLRALGLDDLAGLSLRSRDDLERCGLSTPAIDTLEDLLARYCLTLATERRQRFRRPGRTLDP